jgi:hypothetical protein
MKRLILILIVVLIPFGIMLMYGLNRDHSQERASREPSWMSPLGSLSTKSPVSASDLLPAPCFVQEDLISRPDLPCLIHIRTSEDSNIRTLKLGMIAGHSAKIDLQTHGPAGMEVTIPIRASAANSPEMQIPKEGADLKVLCVEPGPDPLAGSSLGQLPGCRLRMIR